MLLGHRVEVVHDRETRLVRGSGPGVLIWNLSRWTHGYAGRSEESGSGPLSESGVVHGRDVDEEIHSQGGLLFEEPRHLEQKLPTQNQSGVTPVDVGSRDCVWEMVRDRPNQRGRVHGSQISGRGSGSDRLPVVCCRWILSWSFIKPSSTISGRGGHPGM